MGWTFTRREKGISTKDFFAKEFNGEGFEVLDVAGGTLNPTNVYIAMKLPDDKVTAVACLTKRVPRDYHYNYGWKDMSENMGPYICDCPQRIIDQLSPLDELDVGEDAGAWRDRVAVFRTKFDNRLKLEDGMLVSVPYELQFSNEIMDAGTPFRVENAKKKWFARGYFRFKLRKDTHIDLVQLPEEASILA